MNCVFDGENSLWKNYQKLKSSYYGIPICGNSIFDVFFSLNSCRNFIDLHYVRGEKQPALDFVFKEEYENEGKHQHTVALYLLGLYLQDLFDDVLKNKISGLIPHCDNNQPDLWYDFRYTWFLTCLYHDTASCIESHPNNQRLTEQQKTLDFYLGTSDIKYTPFNHTPLRPGISLTRYSESLIKNYFYYRMDHHSLDHGILGGYLLFDKLYRNFKEKTKDVFWDQNHAKEIIGGLNYRPEHLDHFAYISDAIICHNLWTASRPADIDTYKNYGLEPLIVDKKHLNRKLNINDYPLQFLLCLLDSIEPVKRFIEKKADLEPPMNAADVLTNFCINPRGNNAIQIDWCEYVKKQKCTRFQNWLKSVLGLKTWMDVKVTREGETSATITINRR